MSLSPPYLASITPVDSRHAGRVLRTRNLIVYTLLIIGFSSGWCVLALGGLYLLMVGAVPQSVGLGIVAQSIGWLAVVSSLAFTYPEWPHNQWLCAQLRAAIFNRDSAAATDPPSRVVEIVPRERWNKVRLETATDLAIITVHERGVRMRGDWFDYDFPGDSILGVTFESVVPSGWLCRTHLVILVLRTDEGVIEMPVSYRDFRLGSLRSSRRRKETMDLAERISRIARGHVYQPAEDPALESPRAVAWSDNPYASPASIDD